MRFFGYPYNDLVICKDSPDYLGLGFYVTNSGRKVRIKGAVRAYVTNSDRRVRDRVIFTNHIPVIDRYVNKIPTLIIQ